MLHQGIAPFRTAMGKVYISREKVRIDPHKRLTIYHKVAREQVQTLEDNPMDE